MDTRIKQLEEDRLKSSKDYCDLMERHDALVSAHEKLKDILKEIIDCPHWLDEATVPKDGIDVNRKQVVLHYSIALVHIDEARAILKGENDELEEIPPY